MRNITFAHDLLVKATLLRLRPLTSRRILIINTKRVLVISVLNILHNIPVLFSGENADTF